MRLSDQYLLAAGKVYLTCWVFAAVYLTAVIRFG